VATGHVRTHTRTINGRKVTVHDHSRKGQGGKQRPPLLQPRRAGRNLKRAWKAARRHKKAAAFGFGLLCLGELGGWATGQTVGATFTVLALVFGGIGAAALHSTRGKPGHSGDDDQAAEHEPAPVQRRAEPPTPLPPTPTPRPKAPKAPRPPRNVRRKAKKNGDRLWGPFEI
jgi:hypothetical protein